MLEVKTPEEVFRLIEKEFWPLERKELVPLDNALDRVLAEDITASEYVPDFDRSTVDGYAVRASDTFGCSDAIPAILELKGEVRMGEDAQLTLKRGECAYVPTGGAIPAILELKGEVRMGEDAQLTLKRGECAYVPTGGAIPEGADCMVMIEYTEDYGDSTVGILKPGAPGLNLIFRGDDVYPGKAVLRSGQVLRAQDIGALAAIGKAEVPVKPRLKVGVLSTGDELVPAAEKPGPGQVRDVNMPMLAALLHEFGAEPVQYGIITDDEVLLRETVSDALESCDAVILSGGSSAGVKDAACRIIESLGKLLLHGIAIKPGKPTIIGRAGNKPLIGLPGHPVAAYFVAKLFVLPLLARLEGRQVSDHPLRARLSESIGANHGRAQISACRLEQRDGRLTAVPIRSKSGLITQLAGADGYFIISRDCEGLPKDAAVDVFVK